MCYRTATAKTITLHQYLTGFKVMDYPEFYQVSGHSHLPLPVIKADQPNTVQPVQWGLKPFWQTKDFMELSKNEGQTLNTQAEHAFKWMPKFPNLTKQERALTIIEGFYEFRHEQPEKKNGPKTAYYIYHTDKVPFAIPSILWTWVDESTGQVIETVSLLTTAANEMMSYIHNTKLRMPAVLDREGWEQWLDPAWKYVPPQPYRNGGLSSHSVANFLKKGADQNCPEMQLPLQTQTGLF